MPSTVLTLIVVTGLALAAGEQSDPLSDSRPRAAVLCEPSMPVEGAGSSPQTVASILRGAGWEVELLSASQFADPPTLNTGGFDLAILPAGRSFPAQARTNFVEFLRAGGDFISLGGYVFQQSLVQTPQGWAREDEWLGGQREQALSRERSLLKDGGFESTDSLPVSAVVLDGGWRRSDEGVSIVAESPREASRCARVQAPAGGPLASPTVYLDLPAQPGELFEIRACLKTQDVTGEGYAYMAVYQHAADDRIVTFRDFATCRGTQDWTEHRYAFQPTADVARVRLQFGLYRATGTAWFDDVRLGRISGLSPVPMNTATGTPGDGLLIQQQQIGVFDPSFPLRRVRGLRAANGQHIVDAGLRIDGDFAGWAAAGVVGDDNARWIPLWQSFDRYDRPRGAAAAVLLHYNGFYNGSAWACFGVESDDLFRDAHRPAAAALPQVARFLLNETYLHNLSTDQRLYRNGEQTRVAVCVTNRGRNPQSVTVELSAAEAGSPRREVGRVFHSTGSRLEPGATQRVESTLVIEDIRGDLIQIGARLTIDGRATDEMETGVVRESGSVLAAAAESRFVDNYFALGGCPLFLFGSDTYSYTYHTAFDNPLTWSRDHQTARDLGVQVYENLQYSRPGFRLEETDWRAFRAMAQLTQKYNLVFMPGILIGQNVAIDPARLAAQSDLCSAYSTALRDTPALHYYINGDYRLDLAESPEVTQRLWGEWLAERYATLDALNRAWGSRLSGGIRDVPLPPLNSGLWDDVAAIDRARFETELTRRWNEAHVRAIRRHDARHPIMSEYYQRPAGGLDLPLTIDGQDVSDVGYFDEPLVDIDRLPLALRWNDLRARGKGVSLGEYGVKTHPAWSVENGATHYHVRRSEDQQKQLFVAVAHYALGMGAAKVQNWCLQDAQSRVFPWGILHPNEHIPKDVAFVHRNQSVIWRFFRPRYVPPGLTLCLADQLRLGVREQVGLDVAYRAIADLLAGHYDFNVINDHHLDALPSATRVLFYPSPFALREETYRSLLAWVRGGGTLVVTGDVSYDENRQPSRRGRLRELLGVEFVAEHYPNIDRHLGGDAIVELPYEEVGRLPLRPCLECRAATAAVLARTSAGSPVLTRHAVGSGVVFWLADPVELDGDSAVRPRRQALYRALLAAAGVTVLPVAPDAPWLHVMGQPTEQGLVHVVFNTQRNEGWETVSIPTAAGQVELRVRSQGPGLVAVTRDQRVVAVSTDGPARAAGQSLLDGRGFKAAVALDARDLRQSEAILVGPFEPGSLVLPRTSNQRIVCCGEFRDGQWTTLERLPLDSDRPELEIDADRATCMLLVCDPERADHWTKLLGVVLTHPERVAGY